MGKYGTSLQSVNTMSQFTKGQEWEVHVWIATYTYSPRVPDAILGETTCGFPVLAHLNWGYMLRQSILFSDNMATVYIDKITVNVYSGLCVAGTFPANIIFEEH